MKADGFTLLEVAIALVILGLAAALALPGRLDGHGPLELKAAARHMAAGLRRTRDAAVTGNREAAITLDVEKLAWQGADGKVHALPTGTRVSLTTATSERVTASSAQIRFFPEGGSTGGGILLERGGAAYAIHVNWLTGAIEVRHGR